MTKWLVVPGLVLGAAGAQAQEKTRAYIAPYTGVSHLRIDAGWIHDEAETTQFDALQLGAAFGFRAPFGLQVEIGRSHAVHANIFDEHGDFDLRQTYGAVGWRFSFGEGWNFTPKVGRSQWQLTSDQRLLVDDEGARHYELNDWDNFWEIGLARELNKKVSLGVTFQDVDQDFGHSRSGAFTATFAF